MPDDFVLDDLDIPGPKVAHDEDESHTELTHPDMFCSHTDYNALRDAALSLRSYVKIPLSDGTYPVATISVEDGRIVDVEEGSAGLSDGDAGDISVSGGGVTLTIDNGAVTAVKMEQVPALRIVGNDTGAPATRKYLTVLEVFALLGLPASFSSQFALAGSGKDGAIAPANGSTTTLTRDMAWTTFTVPAGTCTVACKGFVPYIHKLDMSSGGTVVFHHDGAAASGATGATGLAGEGSLKVFSGNGSSGIGNAGQAGLAPAGGAWPTSDRAGLGGAGAAGGGGAAGAGGPAATLTADTEGSVNDFYHMFSGQWSFAVSTRLAGGSGGGSAAGSGAPNFHAGGGGGAGGGNCVVCIGEVITPANAGNITVRANGGAGGTGPLSGTTGGGGGGGYAAVALHSGVAATLTAIVVQANGGAGPSGVLGPSGQTKKFGPK